MDEYKSKNTPTPAIIQLANWLFEDGYWFPVLMSICVITALCLIVFGLINGSSVRYDAKEILDGCKAVIEDAQQCTALLAYLAG